MLVCCKWDTGELLKHRPFQPLSRKDRSRDLWSKLW
uniref:Uncharacterized protein n=1 Tax=Phakopsora pachyrhizi TaxID=170000 RepID=A0A0S1MK35_PHAPC